MILEHLVRSDGAGSHFKNKFTMQFMTKFKTDQGLVRATWCIGCPGHGKGKWDGLAGMLKQWLRQMIMDSVLLIKEAKQVYELLRSHFMSDKWKNEHEMNYISVMNIMYISEDEVVRKEPHSYDCTAIHAHGRGCRDLYSFEGVRTNCLQSRVFSCWCVPCTLGGLVSWYEVHQAAHPAVESCIPTAMQLLQRGVGRCENNEEWGVQAIHEDTDRGIASQRQTMRKRSSGICENAEEGAIIAVECWNQGGAAHSFFLYELKKHPEGELVEKAPSQAGKKSKRTNNGEQSQPVAKNDPLYAAQLYIQDTMAGGSQQDSIFLKQEKAVLVNGRGFRYRLATGELTPTGAVQREYRLVPSALEAILGSTYAQA